MRKNVKQQMFEETFILNDKITNVASHLEMLGHDVELFDSNESWLLKNLVSKEMDCVINGVKIKLTASYAYTENERGYLLMHYSKYIDKWNREIVARQDIKNMNSQQICELILQYVDEMVKRYKEYKRCTFTIINEGNLV